MLHTIHLRFGGCIIVGIDVGVTSAVAALDFDGSFVSMASRRGWREHEIVKELVHLKPCIIACDARPPPLVRRLARIFAARLWWPRQALTLREKMRLTKRFIVRNAHERDALASALKAYGAAAAKIRVVAAKARRIALSDEATRRAITYVLKGERVSTALAVVKKHL